MTISSLFFATFNPTGFFALGMNQNTDANNMDLNQSTSSNQAQIDTVEANLSYIILENTKLSVLNNTKSISSCPSETNLDIDIVNTGQSLAKRIKTILPSNIKVLRCNNCEISELKKGETKKINAVVCKQENLENEIKIISANADELLVNIK